MMIRTLLAAVLALLIGSASASATTATAFGDSFTEPGTSWFYVLGLAGNNFARSGAVCNPNFTTLKARRLSTQVQRWKEAGKPTNDWAIVFMGFNDIQAATDTFGPSRTGYRKALDQLRAAGAKLILVTAPDLGRMPRYVGTPEAAAMTSKTKTWNSFVKSMATTYSAGLADLFSKLADPQLIGPDGLHPNVRGQQVIADAIGAAL
jgi:lysophospholipase L1-like esterase